MVINTLRDVADYKDLLTGYMRELGTRRGGVRGVHPCALVLAEVTTWLVQAQRNPAAVTVDSYVAIVDKASAACLEAWDELHSAFWNDATAFTTEIDKQLAAHYRAQLEAWKQENGR